MDAIVESINGQKFGNFVEIVQYSLLCFVTAIAFSLFINKYIFSKTREDIKKMTFYELIVNIVIELIVLIIVFYYVKSVVLSIPSIPSLYFTGFVENTTVEYTVHVAFLYLFLETFPTLKFKIELLREKFMHF